MSHAPTPITILDGGMGHLLRRMGVKINGKVGSLERFLNVATANITNPLLVERAHVDFLKAGAQINMVFVFQKNMRGLTCIRKVRNVVIQTQKHYFIHLFLVNIE